MPYLERPRIKVFNAAKIHTIFPRLVNAVVERIDAAGPAKPVIHVIIAPVIHGEIVLPLDYLKIFRRNVLGRHDRIFTDTDGASTLQSGCDWHAVKLKLNGAAMATAFVCDWRIRHKSFSGCVNCVRLHIRATGHSATPVDR